MPKLVDQPTKAPTRKLAAGGIVGAIAAIATAAVEQWAMTAAASVPALAFLNTPIVSNAIPVVVFFGVGYVVKEKA